MNIQQDYQTFNAKLKQAGIALSTAELHGFLSGLISGGVTDQSWQSLLYQFTNDNHAYPTALLTEVSAIYQQIQTQLGDNESFDFELGLPQEGDVFQSADALSEWVNHFLLGLGLAQPQLDKERGDISEALGDLQDIAQLGYDDDGNQEELAVALEEIIEYVRTIVALFFVHFNAQKPTHSVLH